MGNSDTKPYGYFTYVRIHMLYCVVYTILFGIVVKFVINDTMSYLLEMNEDIQQVLQTNNYLAILLTMIKPIKIFIEVALHLNFSIIFQFNLATWFVIFLISFFVATFSTVPSLAINRELTFIKSIFSINKYNFLSIIVLTIINMVLGFMWFKIIFTTITLFSINILIIIIAISFIEVYKDFSVSCHSIVRGKSLFHFIYYSKLIFKNNKKFVLYSLGLAVSYITIIGYIFYKPYIQMKIVESIQLMDQDVDK